MRTPMVLVVAAALVLCGCRDKARQLSSAEHILAKQHEVWHNARESIRSAQPNLDYIRSVHIFLRGRTRRRVEKEYTGPNKQDILAQLDALKAAYETHVLSKIVAESYAVRLKPGVTLEDVRGAFDKLDEQYRRFQALTAAK